MTSPAKAGRIALGLLPVVVVMIAFFAATPWLKSLDDTVVLLLAAVVAVFVMGYAAFLESRMDRRLDEVQKAGARFSAKWGGIVGSTVFVPLLVLPPFGDLMTSIATDVAADPGATVDQTVVVFSMAMGFMGIVLLQTIGTVVMNVIWWARNR